MHLLLLLFCSPRLTPFPSGPRWPRAAQAVELRLRGDEASDYLNFVVKEEDSGTWYDFNGTNFQARPAPG